MPTTLPGLSVTKSAELLQTQNKIRKSFPAMASVFANAGRATTATDLAPLEMFATVINLKPKSEWRTGMDVDKLIAALDRALPFPASATPGPCRSRRTSTCWRAASASHRWAWNCWAATMASSRSRPRGRGGGSARDLAASTSRRNRHRVLQLCRIEGDIHFAMLSHGPSLHA